MAMWGGRQGKMRIYIVVVSSENSRVNLQPSLHVCCICIKLEFESRDIVIVVLSQIGINV